MDERYIGIYAQDGSVERWPEVDVADGGYARPTTTVNLDARHFVVIPAGFDDWPAIARLQAEYKPAFDDAPRSRRKAEHGDTPGV